MCRVPARSWHPPSAPNDRVRLMTRDPGSMSNPRNPPSDDRQTWRRGAGSSARREPRHGSSPSEEVLPVRRPGVAPRNPRALRRSGSDAFDPADRSAAQGSGLPVPSINRSEHSGGLTAPPDRADAAPREAVHADVRLEFGPWNKGRVWATAAGLLGFAILVVACMLVLGAVSWALAVLGIVLGVVLLSTVRVGLARDPHSRRRHHPAEALSDRQWYRMQRRRLRRIALRVQLLMSHVADWLLTLFWRGIRRLTGTRFG